MSRKVAQLRTEELLVRFALDGRASQSPNLLSGGMAQRLQIARALAHNPSVLFLDEPTAGLDPQSRLAVWDAIEELRNQGVTICLSTHYLEEAERLCDRVTIVDHGELLVTDTPSRLRARYPTTVTVELTFDGDPEQVLCNIATRQSGTVLKVGEDRIEVQVATAEMVPELIAAALEFGLRDVALRRATLESVFFELTGREIRD